MEHLPSGIVTFLFTDVQGSTRLWESYPQAMAAALARHDALLRDTIESNAGYVVKHTGDGFHAVFPFASSALEAAVAAQRALAAEPWGETGPIRVRMALHTGAADERDGDYFGPALNRAARLLDAGHGGQVLVSGATAQVVADDVPPGMELRDLGEHRLKDLARAEHVFQLLVTDLPHDFPPLETLSNRPNNLPVQSTSFLGREHDLLEVRRVLGDVRLVSLLGAGGVGKTRLALEVAAGVLDDFPDGVWFVELAALADPALLSQAVAGVLDVQERRGEPIAQTLLRALRDKQLLLVLDNCEHLIGACAELAGNIIRVASEVKVIVTSREPLRIPNEVRWQVPPLAVPERQWEQQLDRLVQSDSVRLFLDRAAAISPGFSLTTENGPFVAEIVRHLDGIPLAIELAAARINVLSVEQIAKRLDNRFQLLRRGSRTALPRQQTLEALIAWSYDLLSDQEKLLFQRLSVFAGSFVLEAVEEVCSGDDVDQPDVMDLLAQLVDKSLVVADEHGSEYRYRLLESLHAYAGARLRESGDEEQLQRRHALYFLSLAERAEPNLFSDVQVEWFVRLRAESDNFRAVLDWSEASDVELGLRVATALWQVWWLGSQVAEGRSRLERLWNALDRPAPLVVRLGALHARGYLAFRDGDVMAARAHFEAMRHLAADANDLRHVLVSVRALGGMLAEQLDFDSAASLLRESIDFEGKLPDVPASAMARVDLGLVELGRANYDEASRLFAESLVIAERSNDDLRIISARFGQGLVSLARGDLDDARQRFEEILRFSREEQLTWVIPLMLEGVAGLSVRDRLLVRAARLAAAAARLREESDDELAPLWKHLFNPPLEAARQELGDVRWLEAWNEGLAMSIDEAADYALNRAELTTVGSP